MLGLADYPGPTRTKRMSDRDGASVDVDLIGIEFQVPDRGNALGGEGLVDLEDIDVIDLYARQF